MAGYPQIQVFKAFGFIPKSLPKVLYLMSCFLVLLKDCIIKLIKRLSIIGICKISKYRGIMLKMQIYRRGRENHSVVTFSQYPHKF